MQEDAVSSGLGCISRRFSAGLLAASQGKSTQKCRQRRRKCTSGILETHSKQIPHNVGGSLTDDFQPSAACKFLDLPPGACQPVRRGSADPSSLKTVHWTVFRALVPLKSVHWTDFRALEPSKPAKFAGHAWLKFTSSYHHPIMRYILRVCF